jgi:hypothetical protein
MQEDSGEELAFEADEDEEFVEEEELIEDEIVEEENEEIEANQEKEEAAKKIQQAFRTYKAKKLETSPLVVIENTNKPEKSFFSRVRDTAEWIKSSLLNLKKYSFVFALHIDIKFIFINTFFLGNERIFSFVMNGI